GAEALAAGSDAHAGVRVGGAFPLGLGTSRAGVRRRAFVAAEVSADGLRVPRGVGGASDPAGEAARAVPEPAVVGRPRAPRNGRADPGLPLGGSRRAEAGDDAVTHTRD